MRNILLVDDESFVVDGIESVITWKELAIDNVYKASNGAMALELLETIKMDIIVTDMKMPIMDGIEFISKLREMNYDAKVIILSSFDDFIYAQEAIKYNVTEYLLKPITVPILKKAIEKAVIESLNESSNSEYLQALEKQFELYKPVLSDYFFTALLAGDTNYRLAELIGLPLLGGTFRIMAAQVCAGSPADTNLDENMGETKRQLDVLKAVELTRQLPLDDNPHLVTRTSTYNFAVLFYYADGNDAALLSHIEQLHRYLRENEIEGCSIGIGNSFTNINDATISYTQANDALRSHILLGAGSIVAYSDIHAGNAINYPLLLNEKEQLRRCLHSRDKELFKEQLESMKKALHENNVQDSEFLRQLANECIISVTLYLYSENESPQTVLPNYPSLMTAISKLDTLDDIFEAVEKVYSQAIDYLDRRGEQKNQHTIDVIREFVRANISKEISLEILSKHLYLTPNYIGALFKNATNMYFSDYVTQQRMEHAKTLLRDPFCKIYEVADAVGYKNPTYFSKVFREYTGQNPTEYKR